MELRTAALKALQTADPTAKAAAALALHPQQHAGLEDRDSPLLQPTLSLHAEGPLPGRTVRPELVDPRAVKPRSPFTREGRAALLHAVAHIELNAIKMVYNEDNPMAPGLLADF